MSPLNIITELSQAPPHIQQFYLKSMKFGTIVYYMPAWKPPVVMTLTQFPIHKINEELKEET